MKFVFVVESDKEIFYSLSYFSISIRTLLVPYLGTSDLGCHFKGVYIGCIVYADDTLLIYVKKLTSLKLNVRTM